MEADLKIKSYIKGVLEKQKFVNCKITLTSSTEKSDGYASYVSFATVAATTEEGDEKNIEIAVKISKQSFMEAYANLYAREAYFYETILPEFTKFQEQNNVKNLFDSVPKYYGTIYEGNTVAIVMENLREKGYALYDRKKPLSLNHLKLVLREYGKFHAISFALRDKRKNDFEKLTSNLNDIMLRFFKNSLADALNRSMERVCDVLKDMNETELYEMCHKISERGTDVVVIEVMESMEPETAILHGDCWNNNFLFKCENNDVPLKAAILDWQIAKLQSPALDLSYFIYCNSSEEQLEHFDELLDVYYTSFSTFLSEMGCDAEKLFSYNTLLKHWKKYSLFGVIILSAWLHVILCDKEDAPDFNDVGNKKAIGDGIMNVQIKDDTEYRKRLVAVLSHYYKQNF